MFGSWYAMKDTKLVKGGAEEQLDYARELLAELLNRSEALGNVYFNAYQRRCEADGGGPGDKMDYEESIDWLLQALGIFTKDVSEALVRARRARLVYGADKVGGIHTDSVDELEGLEGSLVPWHRDEPAPPGYEKVLVIPKDPKKPKVAK